MNRITITILPNTNNVVLVPIMGQEQQQFHAMHDSDTATEEIRDEGSETKRSWVKIGV